MGVVRGRGTGGGARADQLLQREDEKGMKVELFKGGWVCMNVPLAECQCWERCWGTSGSLQPEHSCGFSESPPLKNSAR